MSAVASTLGNIGVGFGSVGPSGSYAVLSPVSKLLLSFFMLLRRLELFTMLAVLSPGFWKEWDLTQRQGACDNLVDSFLPRRLSEGDAYEKTVVILVIAAIILLAQEVLWSGTTCSLTLLMRLELF